jgi:hypothetical protein
MNLEKMVEIQARLLAATDTPWEAVAFGASDPVTIQADLEPGHPVPVARVLAGGYRAEAMAITGRRVGTAEDDARFIAHARQDVAVLLAEWMANQALLKANEKRLTTVREDLERAEERRNRDLTLAFFCAIIFAGLTLIGGICVGYAWT